jgi:hypothetical protein
MSRALGMFGLLDFTILRPFLAWCAFWNLSTVYFFNFQILFRAAVNCGYWISSYGGTPVLSYRWVVAGSSRGRVILSGLKTVLGLMFVPCIIRRSRNIDMHSAGKHNRRNHDTPAHRSRNHTLYDIPPIRFVFQVTQKDLRSSLMMADHYWNM